MRTNVLFAPGKGKLGKNPQRPIHKLFSGVRVFLVLFIGTSFFASAANAPHEYEQPESVSLRIVGPIQLLEYKVPGAEIELTKKKRAGAIESYFAQNNLPLQANALDFVNASAKYGLDWRLLAAISFIESTGGKYACTTAEYNPFGWHSCKTGFDSYRDAIFTVAQHISGNHKNTEYFYAGKNLRGVLEAYNPPSVIPDYADKVINEMEEIGSFL